MLKNLGLLIFFLLGIISGEAFSQKASMAAKRQSPLEMANYKFNDTYVKITYGKPYKRGREIFGGLVPYHKVWRTGANEATELTNTNTILFGGKELKQGTYSLFTIPGKEKWIIILNKDVGQFGAFEYLEKNDVLRLEVKSNNEMEPREDFLINFSPSKKSNEAILFLWWDKTKVEIPIGILN